MERMTLKRHVNRWTDERWYRDISFADTVKQSSKTNI